MSSHIPPNTVRRILDLEFNFLDVYLKNYHKFFATYDEYIARLAMLAEAYKVKAFAQLVMTFEELGVTPQVLLENSKQYQVVFQIAPLYVLNSINQGVDLGSYLRMVMCVGRTGADGFTYERFFGAWVNKFGKRRVSESDTILQMVNRDNIDSKLFNMLFE
jgi:hypothetical protein